MMVRPAINNDSASLAKLHTETLTESFLARLGLSFLSNLYAFLIKKENVWVYVEKNEVMGFVSFSENSAGMMKRFVFSSPGCIFKLIVILITSPFFLKRFLETFTAPFKSKSLGSSTGKVILPNAELLSISVDPNSQKTGIGRQLLHALEDHLMENNIKKYKVIAGADLESANNFYKKNGFILAKQIMIHGNELSNIYVKEL